MIAEARMPRLSKVLKISAWVAVFIVVVVFLQRYGIEPLKVAVEDMGFWAPLGLFMLRGVSIILPALPSSVYSLLAGSLLGFKVGYLTILFSDLIFCSTAFFIARRWGRGPVSRLVGAGAMEKIDGFSKNQLEGNFFLMTGLLMTGIFDFLSYAIGISRTSWKLFAPALLISVLISDSIVVAVGAGAAKGLSLTLFIALLAMFALATLTGVLKNKAKSQEESGA